MAEQKPGKLINPFAFPSETQLRSILLIWAILGLCWGVGFYFVKMRASTIGLLDLGKVLMSESPEIIDWGVPASDKLKNVLEHIGAMPQELEKPEGRARIQAALAGRSKEPYVRLRTIFTYLIVSAFFLVLIILCILVNYIVRSCRLWLSGRAHSRLAEKPELQSALQNLVLEAQELQRQRGEPPMPRPKFLISRGALGNGQAFGTSRRPFIRLTLAMLAILRKDMRQRGEPYQFRATVFHELAHLANRDVNRSYWAEASGIVLVPVLVLLIATLSMSGVLFWLQNCIRVIASLFVIEWIRRGILRSREYEADLRTAMMWNAGDPLRSSLHENEDDARSSDELWNRFVRFWRKHPTRSERLGALDHPNQALRLNADVPFLAGLLCGSLAGSILPLTGLFFLAMNALYRLMTNSAVEEIIRSHGPTVAIQLYPLLMAAMIISSFSLLCAVSYLLAGTLGVQTQADSMLQIVESGRNHHPYRALLKPAFFTAVGFEIGLILMPIAPTLPGQAWEFLGLFVWVLFAPLPFWGWLSVTRFFARRLLGTHFALRKPVRQLRIVTWASAVLFWPLILILWGGQFWLWSTGQGVRFMVLGAIGYLGFFLALMLLALAVREVRLEEKLPRCPHCGAEVSATSVMADCTACGKSLAPWLFIELPSTLETGAA